MGQIFVEYLTLNLNNTFSISHIFFYYNCPKKRCDPFVFMSGIGSPKVHAYIKILCFLSLNVENLLSIYGSLFQRNDKRLNETKCIKYLNFIFFLPAEERYFTWLEISMFVSYTLTPHPHPTPHPPKGRGTYIVTVVICLSIRLYVCFLVHLPKQLHISFRP